MLGPVEASERESAACTLRRRDVDSDLGQSGAAGVRDLVLALAGRNEPRARDEPVEQLDPGPPGEMVVTGASEPDRRVRGLLPGAWLPVASPDLLDQGAKRRERRRSCLAQPVRTLSSSRLDLDEPSPAQQAQMGRDRGLRLAQAGGEVADGRLARRQLVDQAEADAMGERSRDGDDGVVRHIYVS